MKSGQIAPSWGEAQGPPHPASAPPAAVPVYVAVVDLCCGEEALEVVRSALQAALEALPAAARFGLVTFSHRVQLPIPHRMTAHSEYP